MIALGVVLAALGVWVLLESVIAARQEADERVSERTRWARLSPQERLDELKAKALLGRDA